MSAGVSPASSIAIGFCAAFPFAYTAVDSRNIFLNLF